MKVIIPDHLEGEGGFNSPDFGWDESTLRDASEGLEIFSVTLAGIDLNTMPWNIGNLGSYMYHVRRVQDCSLEYPIILSPLGEIMDGWHRICKAILEGRTTIKAVRLVQLPQPDQTF